jgi:sugar phosphate isomerase/epimerase
MFTKIGISSAGISNNYSKAIRIADEIGFESIDIDLYLKDGDTSIGQREVAAIKSTLASSQLTSETAHAAFFELGAIDTAKRRTSLTRLKRDIDVSLELGLKKIVIHPTHNIDEKNYRQALNTTVESVYHLIEHTGTDDFIIVLENVLGIRDVTLMLEAIDSLPEKNTGICFDNGHALLNGVEKEIIEERANRVVCVHLHDNDMIADRHRLPFQGKADWDYLMPCLNKCNTEVLNLEILDNPLLDSTINEYLKSAYERGAALLSGKKENAQSLDASKKLR